MKRILLFSLLFSLISLNVNCQNKGQYVGAIPNGIYQTKSTSSGKNIYIVVKDSCVTGIFKDKIKEQNKLKTAKVFFAQYNDEGLKELTKLSQEIVITPDNECESKYLVKNTENDKNLYYVLLYASREECWYKFD